MATQNKSIKEQSLDLYQEESFHRDSWFQIASADYEALIKDYDFAALFSSIKAPVSLLDLGCGTGKFPSMLKDVLDSGLHINYSCLDPSEFSLQECRNNISAPFYTDAQYQSFFENMKDHIEPEKRFDIIWSIQSLYCADASKLQQTIENALCMLKPHGRLMIYLASPQSSYMQAQNLYHAHFAKDAEKTPYNNAIALEEKLKDISCAFDVYKLTFDHVIPSANKGLLEIYLNQCALAEISIEDWLGNEDVHRWLEQFKRDECYAIPQNVWFFDIKNV